MKLRTQILLSMIGITLLSQIVFGLLSYYQIEKSRSDQLTIFLQVVNRQAAEYLMLTDDPYAVEVYLEELRKKFSTPESILIIQSNNKILYIAGDIGLSKINMYRRLNEAYAASGERGLIELEGTQYYWAVSQLPDDNYKLVMLQPASDEEKEIASSLKLRMFSFGIIVLWVAVWISIFLSVKISKQLDEKNSQLEYMALHDSLTELPNRKLLTDRLEQEILQARRNKKSFSLFIIDLDRFKEINDTLGHQFGDELLKLVSERLLLSVRDMDSIARLGGDEFAVLLPETGQNGAVTCADKILLAMEQLFMIGEVSTESKASIGIAIFPEHGDTSDALFKHADIAMYQAKRNQSGYSVYDPSKNTHNVRRLRLMNDLRDAIQNNHIGIHYQPLINTEKNCAVSAEALARWKHPELGDVSPSEFIPMAEQMGLMRQLTLQLLKQAVFDCDNWKKRGLNLDVNVNVSTFCLQDLSFPDEVERIIQKFGIDAGCLELEITETTLMHDLSRAGKILDKLSEIGVRLAIDDFGTGFSSLNYLKNLPVDTLKIDKSFISDMCDSPGDNAIVKTIVDLGRNLDVRVVAEGVENFQTLESLKLLNINIVQGYIYNKPKPLKEFLDWLDNFNGQVAPQKSSWLKPVP